ncbi:APC family permease [Vagococcus jeotgali]|uniref:APC family permease n=1 Tax=Vagococcus jeotgali TaxID=3109030 RepID=UPI002DD9AEE5|nr:APC family permease [Vagococcus sp. B2T-5]
MHLSVFLGINAIIGSGAFLLPQDIYKDIGVTSILVLFVAALTVSMIALCYADLSSRFSGSGAAWLYSYNAFGKFTGFQIGLFSWFLGCLTLAAESVALLRVLKNLFPAMGGPIMKYAFPVGMILILAVINLFGTTIVKKIDNVSSVFKIGTIVFFIVLGVFFIKFANFKPLVPSSVTGFSSFSGHFGKAFSVVFYMFTGFSFIPVAAAQMDNPQKNIPKTLITVMMTVMVLYVLVQAIVIGILGSSIVKYDIPIANALDSTVGHWAYVLIIIGMLVSIFGVAFAISFSTPVLAKSLAKEHNLLPSMFTKENSHGAPWVAILFTTVISVILVSFGYIFLVACIVLASFIQYVPSILAVIKFKHNGQFPNQGFKLKGGYTIPIIALIISMYLLTNFTVKVLIVALVVFGRGLIMYFTSIRKKDEPAAVTKSKQQVTGATK